MYDVRTLDEPIVLHESTHALQGVTGSSSSLNYAGLEGEGYAIQYIWNDVLPHFVGFEEAIAKANVTSQEVVEKWYTLAGIVNKLISPSYPVIIILPIFEEWHVRDIEETDIVKLAQDGFVLSISQSGLLAGYQQILDQKEFHIYYTNPITNLPVQYYLWFYDIPPINPEAAFPRSFKSIYW